MTKCLITAAMLAVLTIPFTSPTQTDAQGRRARRTPTAPPTIPANVTDECPDGIDTLTDCPQRGCGPNGDALLNAAKNRTDVPAASAVQALSLDDIRAIPAPSRWNTGSSRSSITGAGREGTPVVTMGFLKLVKAQGAESCNCGLSQRANTDLHFVLVSDIDDDENTSVTVEVAPRLRADHPDWTFTKTRDELEGQFIRVTGWLMLDTKHIPQARRLPDERANRGLKRATNWEVHPITKLEVCTRSVRTCRRGNGWEEF